MLHSFIYVVPHLWIGISICARLCHTYANATLFIKWPNLCFEIISYYALIVKDQPQATVTSVTPLSANAIPL